MGINSSFFHLKAIFNMMISSALVPLFKFMNRHRDGIFVLNEDWDILVILDACRCDVFKVVSKRFKLEGDFKCVKSRGSSTKEFLEENFLRSSSNILKNIVYVSANPFVDLFLKDKVYKIISVWRNKWDKSLGTVPPDSVYEEALRATLKYFPKKRIIIHFIQPHYPFRLLKVKSSTLEKFTRLLNLSGSNLWIYTHLWISAIIDHSLSKSNLGKLRGGRLKIVDNPIYRIDKKLLLRAYLDNLIWALEIVKKLVNVLPGKIVITSDHGDSFGESLGRFPIEVYGHPPYLHMKSLLEVPWLETNGRGSKKKIIRELSRIEK